MRVARLSLQAGLIVITLGAVLRGDFGVGLGEAPVGPDTVRVLQWNTNWPSSDDPRTMAALGGTPADRDPATAAPNHSNRVTFDEPAMATGIATYAALALDRLRV